MKTHEWCSAISGIGMFIVAALSGGSFVLTAPVGTAEAATQVKLEVLDPRAEFSTPPAVPITARLEFAWPGGK